MAPRLLIPSVLIHHRICRFALQQKNTISSNTSIMAPDRSRSQPRNKLQEWFPNTQLPIIMSAPMLGISSGKLAAQVSKAGGFGPSFCLIIHPSRPIIHK